MKIIPKVDEGLRSIIAADEQWAYTEYEEVTDNANLLEDAKKELSEPLKEKKVKKVEMDAPGQPTPKTTATKDSFF